MESSTARYPVFSLYITLLFAYAQPAISQESCKVLGVQADITYSGECKNGLANGQGRITWPDGSTFEGEFLLGKPSGRGIHRHSSGASYEGQWHEGKFSGEGVLRLASGDRYEGQFDAGKRSGYGTFTWASGNWYRGQFVDGKAEGRGEYIWASGGRYEGDFKNWKFHGHGVLTRAAGQQIEGEFVEGKITGRGTLRKADGTRVAGIFSDGKFTPDSSTSSYGERSRSGDTLQQIVDAVAPRDIVTGQRSLNLESEQEEIQRATRQTREIIAQSKAKGATVDTDQWMLERMRGVMMRIVQVSHRPSLPWELHLIESPESNAFTIGGGKLFFYRGIFGGLLNQNDDNEIAAVLAHEIAHVTARHIGERQGMEIGRQLLSRSKGRQDSLYRASFTTVQEDEADRVGLLYMALAGFDPRAASRIWGRAHQRYGSNPGNYLYDHSLNIDRMRKVASLTPIALKYYRGSGVLNPEYAQLRLNNELIPTSSGASSESGIVALLEAGLGIALDTLEAKSEERSRRAALQDPAQARRLAMQSTRILNLSNRGKGVFGQLQNVGGYSLTGAEITIYYLDASGRPIRAQPLSLSAINLPRGATINWSGPLVSVPGTKTLRAAVTKVEFSQ